MITAIISAQPLLIAVLLASSVIFTSLGIFFGRHFSHSKRAIWASAGLSLALILSATLTPAKNSSGYSGSCTIDKDPIQAVGTEQWVLNALLFVPAALFFILGGISCLRVLSGLAVLSVGIEIAQADIPGIGRACDSDDFVANTLGVLVVVTLFLVHFFAIGKSRSDKPSVGGRLSYRGLIIQGGVSALVLIVGLFSVTMTFVSSSTPIVEASSNESRVAENSLGMLFGHNVKVTRTQISSLPNNYGAGQKTLVASWADGIAEFSWPGKHIYTVQSSTGVHLDGYGGSPTIDSESSAKALAAQIAQKNFDGVGIDSRVSVDSDPEFPSAWRVSYRAKLGGKTETVYSVTLSNNGRLMRLAMDNKP